MAKARSAGDLKERVAFDARVPGDDGAGNVVEDWEQRFQRRAGFIHLRGGESVMASRLAGKHTLVIFVRRDSETREITTEWRVRNARDGTIYNIADITPSTDGAWLDLLCESGVDAG